MIIRAMNTVKEEAKKLVESLPDDAQWQDLLYEVELRRRIAEGLQAIEDGRTVAHEEVKRRFSAP